MFSNLATSKTVQLDMKILALKVKLPMSVLIDKSVCPQGSEQRAAMQCVMSAGGGGRPGGGGRAGWRTPARAHHTHMHGCLLSRCMRTDRLVDEDGHGEVDRQYDPNSVDELNMP